MPGRIYNILHAFAVDQNGYITTRDAQQLGVDPHRLALMKDRQLLEPVSRGVYRFPDVPAGPLDQYRAATLWPLPYLGVLSHATALDLHELCDINPAHIDLIVAPRARTKRPEPNILRLHHEDLDPDDITWHEGLPIVGVERAIRGAVDEHVGWNLIGQAIDTARATGRVTTAQAKDLRALRPKAHQ